jgi:hypothetical protein
MSDHAVLDNVTHQDLKIDIRYQIGHGFDFHLSRVFPVEFSQIQSEYPIFFIKNKESNEYEAVCLFGFEEDENLFLSDEGWQASYIPLGVQRYPFLIGFQEKVEAGVPTKEAVVHVDMAHPSISSTEGQPVFLEGGGNSPLLERITSVLMTINQGYPSSKNFSQALSEFNLIESLKMNVQINDKESHSLDGLYTINEDKVRELDDSQLGVLHRSGYLQHIYMVLASTLNVNKLIRLKNK